VGVTTQDSALELRLGSRGGRQAPQELFKDREYGIATIARACGKQDVHHLEKEDLVALTVEAARHGGCSLGGERRGYRAGRVRRARP